MLFATDSIFGKLTVSMMLGFPDQGRGTPDKAIAVRGRLVKLATFHGTQRDCLYEAKKFFGFNTLGALNLKVEFTVDPEQFDYEEVVRGNWEDA